MTPVHRDTPRTLPAILASLHPWLRARVSSITVWSRDGGWDAQLSFLDHTSPPPRDIHIPAGSAEYPGDTHHPLNLPLEQPEPTLLEQVRELEAQGEFGRLAVRRFPEATALPDSGGTPSCGLASGAVGWLITLHADEQERQQWRRRMGQKGVSGPAKR